ncbi:hypothetical protein BJX76DRAFT_367291 [Aspergillus varians]
MHPPTPSEMRSPKPLAVVGLALRYPGDAVSPETFWQMMMDRRCASSRYPSDRLNIDAHHNPTGNRHDSLSIDGGHFLTGDMGAFDPAFFSLTAAEAEGMDPQQRMALELSYQALENAGFSIAQAAGTKTCVFTGCSGNDYGTMHAKDPQFAGKYVAYSQAMCMVANRISWFFNLLGPSANVDTACSSSLVALDLACQSIWAGASDMGLAVGVNLILAREWSNSLDNLGFFSKDNRCFSFDEKANGYSRGEGLGAVVIKPLEDAVRDGDTIRAVIRSTLSNQDGRTPGITLPSRQAQKTLIEEAYRHAGLSPALTRYFEAHGTGTAVGDPTETRAIGAVFRPHRSADDPLYIGSVKSNIGHLEGGSGIAGVIKVILSLEKGIIPPVSDYYTSLNPRIDAEHLNMRVVSGPVPWPKGLRRASVNSFGFGGANSHVILEDAYHHLREAGLDASHNTTINAAAEDTLQLNGSHATAHIDQLTNGDGSGTNGLNNGVKSNGVQANNANSQPQSNLAHARILTWSAADKDGLSRASEDWEKYFSRPIVDSDLSSLAYTLNEKRSHMLWRCSTIVSPEPDLSDIVSRWSSPIRSTDDRTLAYIFTGQGAQWPTMGRELLERYPVYHSALADAGEYLRSLGSDWDPLGEDVMPKEAGECPIDEPKYAQPLCTALQIALVDLLSTWGLRPTAVVGHSSGEIAAAYCAGAISREYALRLAYFRGVVGSKLALSSSIDGAMMAVSLSQEQVQPYLDALHDTNEPARVVIACFNSPTSITVSGHRGSIEQLHSQLKGENVLARILPVPVAYHSFQMQEVAATYEAAVGDDEKTPTSADTAQAQAPQMVSSVHGDIPSSAELSRAAYWVSNLVSPVRFADALRRLQLGSADKPTKKLDGSHRGVIGVDSWLEIGPHAALRGPCRDSLQAAGTGGKLEYLPTLMRKNNAVQTILDTAARLHCLGHEINLAAVNVCPQGKDSSKPKLLTDLPAYSFNHNKSYWREGRISKGFRFRRFGRHELLGWPDDDWNPLLPKWSNILQPSDPVWVQDHKVDNVIILPGAAMITMAVEAIKQVVDPDTTITGYELKNVNFMSALKITAGGSGAETRFHLRPQGSAAAGSSTWWEFTLCSHDGSWVKNCVGTIKPITQATSKNEADGSIGGKEGQLQAMSSACPTSLDANRFYEMLGSFGYQFGPAFVRISSIVSDLSHRLVTDVLPYKGSNAHWSEQYTIHPTTLDALMQTVPLLRSQGGTKKIPISIPSHIERAWLSNTGLSAPGCPSIKVGTTIEHFGRQECVSGISVWDEEGQKSLIEIEGVVFTSIGSQPDGGEKDEQQISKCQQVEWKPDVDLMPTADIEEYCASSLPAVVSPGIQTVDIDTVILGYISQAVDLLDASEPVDMTVEQQRYVDWLRYQKGLHQEKHIQLEGDALGDLCSLVSNSSAEGMLYVKTGEALLESARGNQIALGSIQTGLIEAAYDEKWKSSPSAQRLRRYLDAFAHKSPDMRILEVNGGIGSIAGFIIETLRAESGDENQIPRFQQLDLAGSDNGLLSALQEKFNLPAERLSLKDVDIQSLPQGVEEEYDLIILNEVSPYPSNVFELHAYSDKATDSTSRRTSLQNARSLLKLGGRLFVIQAHDPQSLRQGFIHGPPQSWNKNCAEPAVQSSLDKEDWDSLLTGTGFAPGLGFLDDSSALSNRMDTIISSAVPVDGPPQIDDNIPHVILVSTSGSVPQQHFAKGIENSLQSHQAYRVDHLSLGQALPAETTPSSVVCVLCEIESPILGSLEEPVFQHLQQLFTSSHKVLWVNNGAGGESSPFFRIADGLFRVLNSEYDSRTFATLSIDNGTASPDLATRVVQSLLSSSSVETEYVERSGVLYIPRLVEATPVSQALAAIQPTKKPILQAWNAESDRKLSLETPGLLDSLHFVKDTDRGTPLPDHMMEVKVKAVGVNFRDLLVLLGRMDQTTVGFECAGIVTRVGADCANFNVGDHVVGCEFDTYRSYARLQRDTAIRIPEGMSFTDAAAVPINFVTAWHALSALANVQPGEIVLVHSAAGGTGQAAVQVAQFLGAKVIATAGSAQKKKLLMDLYGVPETNIFSSRSADFAAGVKALTNGQGADVVLNSLSGDLLTASWECIAPYGRFIEIGKRDIMGHSPLDMYYFARNVTFSAVDVALMVKERPRLVGRALAAVMPLLSSGALRISSPNAVYGIGEMEAGLRVLQGGQSSGKVVVEMRDDDMVRAIPTPQQHHHFDPNATYVIAGGLGGLGRGIARWMVSCGARYLLLMSRSGARDEQSAAFLEELADKQVAAVATPCDITDRSMLEAFVGDASHHMPPIKGCIQATMVLQPQDSMFETMTYDQWSAATAPKVQGTWNLHDVLPKGLDFFIMLSSIASIMGNRGQANYAAANSFMDALAHHRASLGEQATALNLGLFLSAGVAAQSPELQERYLSSLPFTPVTEAQLHALLAYHCHPSRVGGQQTVLGLEPTAAQQRKPAESSYWLRKPAFRQLAMTYSANASASTDEQDTAGDIDQELASATTVDAAAPLITGLLVSKLSSLLGSPADEFDVKKPLHAYGVDSLVAVEIRNWFAKQVKADIAVFDLLGGATLEGVGRLVATKRLF